jgi:uncharacterized membrane protein YwzB
MQWIGKLDGYNNRLYVGSGLTHLHIYNSAELNMLPHAFLTDTGWDQFIECKTDEAWEVKQFDPNVTCFWSLVCPFRTENTNICAERLGGEDSEDNNLLGSPGAPSLNHDMILILIVHPSIASLNKTLLIKKKQNLVLRLTLIILLVVLLSQIENMVNQYLCA